MSEVTFRPWDPANYLDDDADIAALLDAAAAEGDAAVLAMALGAVARARNMSQLAREVGLTRAGLSKALGPNGNPRLATVVKVADALGLELVFRPKTDA